jgi:hypothetical protein
MLDLEDELGLKECDDGEQFGDVHIFFVAAAASQRILLAAASRVTTRSGVPEGAFAMITDTALAPRPGKRSVRGAVAGLLTEWVALDRGRMVCRGRRWVADNRW